SLKVTSYEKASGRIRGVMEWPEYDARHEFSGWIIGDKVKIREVHRLKKGAINIGLCYTITYREGTTGMEGACKVLDNENQIDPEPDPKDERPWDKVEEANYSSTAGTSFDPGDGTVSVDLADTTPDVGEAMKTLKNSFTSGKAIEGKGKEN